MVGRGSLFMGAIFLEVAKVEGAEMSKITLVVVGYNRPKALAKLLTDVNALLVDGEQVDLVIGLDGGAPESVQKIATVFHHKNGSKKLISHHKNLGLRQHILSCGDLTKELGNVIILEDDLELSPYLFQYAEWVLNKYENENSLAGFSLYAYRLSETSLKAFYRLKDDPHPVHLMSFPSSWGQLFTPAQWNGFRAWLEKNENKEVPLPPFVKKWSPGSWKRDMLRYMIDTEKDFLYPYQSYTTNKGYKGVNFPISIPLYDVPLADGFIKTDLPDLHQVAKYDEYFELSPSIVAKLLPGVEATELTVDILGSKHLVGTGKVLTSKAIHAPESVDLRQYIDKLYMHLKLGDMKGLNVPPDEVDLLERVYQIAYDHGMVAGGWWPKQRFKINFLIANYIKVLLKMVSGK